MRHIELKRLGCIALKCFILAISGVYLLSPFLLFSQPVDSALALVQLKLTEHVVVSQPVVISDDMGGFWVVYKSSREGEGKAALYLQHVGAGGETLLEKEGRRICDVNSMQSNHKITSDGKNGLYVVWEDARGDRQIKRSEDTANAAHIDHDVESPMSSGIYTKILAQHINEKGENLWDDAGMPACHYTSRQKNPIIISDKKRNLYVLWEDQRNEDKLGTDIYGQRFIEGGHVIWGKTGKKIISQAQNQQNIQLDMAADNTLLVLWDDFRNGKTWKIYGQKIKSNGEVYWIYGDILLNPGPRESIRYPSFFGDGFGGIICIYELLSDSTKKKDIYISRVNRSGRLIYKASVCAYDEDQSKPRIIKKGAEAIVYWEDFRSGASDIYAQKLDFLDGQLYWLKEGIPIASALNKQHNPVYTTTTSYGEQIIAWEDKRNGNTDIYVQKIDMAGVISWQKNGLPVCVHTKAKSDLGVTTDGKGGCWLVWVDSREEKGVSIMYQHISAEGEPVLAQNGQYLITEPEEKVEKALNIAIKEGYNKDVYVVWEDYRNGNKNPDIYMQRLDRNGNVLWRRNGKAICTVGGYQYMPKVLPVRGGAYVCWIDRRNGNDDLYMQFVDSAGYLQWNQVGLPICIAPKGQSGMSLSSPDGELALVAWSDSRYMYDSGFDIYIQEINKSGYYFYEENGKLIAGGKGIQLLPRMKSHPLGGTSFVWMDQSSGHFSIKSKRLSGDGANFWFYQGDDVAATTTNQRFPALSINAQGDIFVVWSEDRYGMEYAKVFAQKLNSEGKVQWEKTGIGLCDMYGRQTFPQTVCDDSGGVVVSWLDQRNEERSGHNLYTQRINAEGKKRWKKQGMQLYVGLHENNLYTLDSYSHPDSLVYYVIQGMDGDKKTKIDFITQSLETGAVVSATSISSSTYEQREPVMIVSDRGFAMVAWSEISQKDKDRKLMLKCIKL